VESHYEKERKKTYKVKSNQDFVPYIMDTMKKVKRVFGFTTRFKMKFGSSKDLDNMHFLGWKRGVKQKRTHT